jgi:hypothetical protein
MLLVYLLESVPGLSEGKAQGEVPGASVSEDVHGWRTEPWLVVSWGAEEEGALSWWRFHSGGVCLCIRIPRRCVGQIAAFLEELKLCSVVERMDPCVDTELLACVAFRVSVG